MCSALVNDIHFCKGAHVSDKHLLFAEWDMLGQSFKLNNKWMAPIITKVLITTRWRLNTLIDAGQPKPADVTDEQWDTLMRRRKSEGSQVISDHMRSISQGRASKTAQLKSIERDAIVKLVSSSDALIARNAFQQVPPRLPCS